MIAVLLPSLAPELKSKRWLEAMPIIEREPADEVQASLDDLDTLDTVNLDNDQDYGV